MKLSLKQLTDIAAAYVAENKIAVDNLAAVRESVTGLVETIGAIFTLDTSFKDKLTFMNAEDLSNGKTVEEWQADLLLPTDYDQNGTNALKPSDPSFRPVEFSITLGEKTFKTTERKNTYNKAVHNEGQLGEITAMIMKRLYDSKAAWDYQIKREALAKFIDMCFKEEAGETTLQARTAYAVNTLVTDGTNAHGIVVKPIKTDSGVTSYNDGVAKGFIVTLSLIQNLAKPIDTATGEAFVKAVKIDVEKFQDISEGGSLNGNTLGAEEGLVLLVKQGIMPIIEVDVEAGAFNGTKVAIPTEIFVVKDFGSDTHGAYALLMDRRAVRKFNSSLIPDTDHNGEGHFDNYYIHVEDTIHISRNAAVKVYYEG